ncbi:PspC domain-containing protein [Nocardia suismassiliense]|uniref:PspC domain-containing protein n=1 Tax=Nocardia suismassiliense TaxID=2077092 RepID=UPI002D786C92|nr:PspC domain-containing protein [Nocardia suismassiliense]
MTKTSFGDQLQQIWRTRPARLPRQGPIAGVAAGFAQRYNVDPVLVRVAFVVSAIFGGSGVVLYLLAWLLFSAAGDESSAAESLVGKGHSSQSQTKTIVLIVALAIAVSTMGPVGVGLGGSGLISMALMLAGWWMMHLRNPEPPPGTTSEFSGYIADNGIMATGYPGAVFPQGAPRTTSDVYAPPTSVYTPYTKLPDAYVPETSSTETVLPHQVSDTGQVHEADTDLLRKREASDQGSAASDSATRSEKGDAPGGYDATPDTVRLDKGGNTTEVIDPGTAAGPTASAAPGRADTDTPSLSKEAPSSTLRSSGADTSAVLKPPTPATLGRTTPPSWDPLGVAPLAWDLPEPTPVRTIVAPPPRRPRSRLTPVVLGLAILAAAGAGALAASGVEWMTPGRIAAAALAVIGLGLVLGAFLRRGYGLLVLTAPLAGFVLLASAIGPIDFDRGAMGQHDWTPTTVSELQSHYTVNMGSGTLDLRRLNLTENRTVDVEVRMGDFQVWLPNNMKVDTQCTQTMGEVQCVNGLTGPTTEGAPVLDLNINVRAGNAEVHRG